MKIRLISILLILFFTACSSLNKLSLYNLSGQYNNTLFTRLDAVAFNTDDQSVSVFVPVLMSDMVSVFDENTGKTHRDALLRYEMFENYDSKQILDSAGILITDSNLMLVDTMISFKIRYPSSNKFILKLELVDLNRVDVVRNYLWLDNSSPASSDHYLLKDADGDLMFTKNVSGEDDYSFELTDKAASSVYVRYYKRDFPLALPPFLEETETNFEYGADSIFVIEARDGRTALFHLPEKGFYHFQTDSNTRSGYTIFRFDPGFPQVQSSSQMLDPLRYITTVDEFREMQDAVDVKLAIDNFWLNNAGNPTRARAMIQKYYGRVVDANQYFTSYHEGWKTDRGLMYIVYGPPRIVYRGEDIEEWLYGEKGNKNSIRLQFVKVINPFSENDYSLIKSPSYKEKWYNIVSTWRR